MALTAQPGLPPPPVQPPPMGWLGFLGIKSGGRQPGQVNPTLSPTFEMFKFYQAGQRVRLVAPGVGIALVNNTLVTIATVPAGRVWLVESATCLITPGAVAPTAGAIFVLNVALGTYAKTAPGEPYVTAVPTTLFLKDPGGVIIMGPGDQLAFRFDGAGATTVVNVFPTVVGIEVLA